MSDFEQFLEAVLNEPFLDNSTAYYQDELTATEVEDMESGLAGEFAPADVQQLLHDVEEHDHSSYKAVRFPDRVGTNYPKGDALSCYKILPKKQGGKPHHKSQRRLKMPLNPATNSAYCVTSTQKSSKRSALSAFCCFVFKHKEE